MRTVKGTNQYAKKYRYNKGRVTLLMILLVSGLLFALLMLYKENNIVRTVVPSSRVIVRDVYASDEIVKTVVEVPTVTPTSTPILAPEPTPSELESIVAYIARVFEKEGKHVVVRAINCFYSESGLRAAAVGQNNDAPKSKDHGVAQLNDYWHKLTEEQKTNYKANIDKAYQIYKGRGGNFSAWYGKLCN